jgi:hypothetical protein
MLNRSTVLATLVLVGSTTVALAQSTPPANSTMPPPNSSSPQMPTGGISDDSSTAATPSGMGDKVGQDPKMKTCMTSEKAKNNGLSEDQLKQKCMMQIASHQGQGK